LKYFFKHPRFKTVKNFFSFNQVFQSLIKLNPKHYTAAYCVQLVNSFRWTI